jgi:SAM-dependent methyltransferase
VLAQVRERGLTEPFTGLRQAPDAIGIDPGNLRESLLAQGLNCRMRALLLQVVQCQQRWPRLAARSVRIYAPEAITRTALLFRGRYPQFLGSEYLPDAASRAALFPIPHIDLQAIDLPDGAFDLTFSGDVLEHVADLGRALGELARILRPGGVLVATVPLDPFAAASVTRAREVDGRVEHLLEPEYHRNPVAPGAGSLVYVTPGWDLLERARAAGFAEAWLTLQVSARHGITGDGIPGDLVLCARRPGD